MTIYSNLYLFKTFEKQCSYHHNFLTTNVSKLSFRQLNIQQKVFLQSPKSWNQYNSVDEKHQLYPRAYHIDHQEIRTEAYLSGW